MTIAPGYIKTAMTAHNPYSMPFLMDAGDFARRAHVAIERGASYRVIPWQMGVVARLMRLLPNAVYDRLARNAPRRARRADSVRPGRQRTTSLRVSPLTWLTSPQSSTCHSRPLTPTRLMLTFSIDASRGR